MPRKKKTIEMPPEAVGATEASVLEAISKAQTAREAHKYEVIAEGACWPLIAKAARLRASTLAWGAVEANRGLLVDYIRTAQSWIIGVPGLYEDAIEIGLLLLYQAADTYDPAGTTFGGWAHRVFAAQLVHRIREFQGKGEVEVYSLSTSDASEDDDTDPEAAPVKTKEESAEETRSFVLRMRAEIKRLQELPCLARLLGRTRRAVVRAVLLSLLGASKPTIERARREAMRRGARDDFSLSDTRKSDYRTALKTFRGE